MSKSWKKKKKRRATEPKEGLAFVAAAEVQRRYERVWHLAESGRKDEAVELLERLNSAVSEVRLKALIRNDLAALVSVGGNAEAGRNGFEEALAIDPTCETARRNLAFLDEGNGPEPALARAAPPLALTAPQRSSPGRVAIVSSLFNWPSTGGGIVHTVELAKFLTKAGYAVRHFYARHDAWDIGRLEGSLPFESECLSFDDSRWTAQDIQARFRQAVSAFEPDAVIVTDSWNFKPLLAEAVRDYPYILRLQAMECLCPLNNVRLLPEPGGLVRQCVLNQLSHPKDCVQCLEKRAQYSGSLHQAERALSGVGSELYHDRLVRVFREAESVLVVNPLTAAMVAPYARDVRVVTAGMDPSRFPWPWPNDPAKMRTSSTKAIFFAGLVEERMKGFDVLQQACAILWQRRRDFEVIATADPPGQFNEFTRFIGWQSQEDLPRQMRAADLLAMPTIAQEALGRTAVEAMAAGIPVVASSLGGLPFTVLDGVTGLLFAPGDVADLAEKIEVLLDNAHLRERLGTAARTRFEEHYSWDVIIERHYRPLLARCRERRSRTDDSADKSTTVLCTKGAAR